MPDDNWILYADASRGFRSGGFNQTGVGTAVPYPGIEDIFDEQIADTFEVGAKGDLVDGKVRLSAALYQTTLEGAYFFYYACYFFSTWGTKICPSCGKCT